MKSIGRHVFRSCGLALLIAMTTVGCAGIIRGTTENISISSVPSGASVTADGKEIGVTPTSAALSRYDAHSIRIEKPGFIPFEVRTNSIPDNPWWFADSLWPAAPLDPGLYKIDPPEISANLIPLSSTANASATAAPLPSGNRSPSTPPPPSSSPP